MFARGQGERTRGAGEASTRQRAAREQEGAGGATKNNNNNNSRAMPSGTKKRLAIECSKPIAANADTGSHAPTNLPVSVVAAVACQIDRHTKMLQSTPRTNATPHGSDVLATAAACGAAAPATTPDAAIAATNAAQPSALPRYEQSQLLASWRFVARPCLGRRRGGGREGRRCRRGVRRGGGGKRTRRRRRRRAFPPLFPPPPARARTQRQTRAGAPRARPPPRTRCCRCRAPRRRSARA